MNPAVTHRGGSVSLHRHRVGVPVQGNEWFPGRLPNHKRIPDPLCWEPPGETEFESSGDLLFVAGHGRNVDELDEGVDQAHTSTSKVRRASLSDVLRSVDSERYPISSGAWR